MLYIILPLFGIAPELLLLKSLPKGLVCYFASHPPAPQGASGWNLARLPRVPGSLFRHWRAEVPNVTAPTLRLESLFGESDWIQARGLPSAAADPPHHAHLLLPVVRHSRVGSPYYSSLFLLGPLILR